MNSLGRLAADAFGRLLFGVKRHAVIQLVWILCFATVGCVDAGATLIIAVHAGDSVYLASDSAIKDWPGAVATKIATVSNRCCVAIGGFAGGSIIDSATKQEFQVRLFDRLRVICDSQSKAEPSGVLVTNIASQFSTEYASFLTRLGQKVHANTCLLFVGFDDSGGAFATQYVFNETNRVAAPIAIFAGGLSNAAGPFIIYGEPSFAYLIARSPERFSGMHAEKALQNVRDIYAGEVLSDEQMTYTILELFRLHKMSFEAIWIGPPYVIYKLTKTSLTKLQ